MGPTQRLKVGEIQSEIGSQQHRQDVVCVICGLEYALLLTHAAKGRAKRNALLSNTHSLS